MGRGRARQRNTGNVQCFEENMGDVQGDGVRNAR